MLIQSLSSQKALKDTSPSTRILAEFQKFCRRRTWLSHLAHGWELESKLWCCLETGRLNPAPLLSTQACYYLHKHSEIVGDSGCGFARCEKSIFRLGALSQKHHSHTTQTSSLVPTQPADSDLLKTFQGVTLWQKILCQVKYQPCSCSQHKAPKLIRSHMAMLACRH